MVLPLLGHTTIAALLMANVYCSSWPLEATLMEALWGVPNIITFIIATTIIIDATISFIMCVIRCAEEVSAR